MAADQVKVRLAEGVDVTDLKPMIDALGIRLRMFNRKERAVVLGVLHTGIDAVPDTLEALRPLGGSLFCSGTGLDSLSALSAGICRK